MSDDIALSSKEIAELKGISRQAVEKQSRDEDWPYDTTSGPGRGGVQRRFYLSSLPDDIRLLYNKVQLEKSAIPIGGSLKSATSHLPVPKSDTPALLTDRQYATGGAKIDLLRHYLDAIKSLGHGQKSQARDDFLLTYNSGYAYPAIYRILGPTAWQTIEGWKRILSAGGAITELADRRGRWNKGKTIITAAQASILVQCALHPNRLLPAEVIREARRRMHAKGLDNGLSEATYRRWLIDFKEHNYNLWCWQRGGEKRWNDECALSVDRDPELLNVGDVLVADGHTLNFDIINPWTGKPQRMTLIVFYDMRSNFPCGWEIMPTENTAAISAALRRAILTLGKMPRVVYLDNGRAFKAKYFTETDLEGSGLSGLYEQLGIQTVFAWAYHGQSKTVERFFGTFAELERKSLTYTGTSIDKKPPRMKRGERLHRKIHEKVMAGKCVTIEMAHRAVAGWFDEYSRRPQQKSKYLMGYAPIDLFEPGRGEGIDPLTLTYLMWSKKDVTIRGSRISFNGRFYYHKELEWRHHKAEIRYDLADPGYIAVFEGGKFLCIAPEQDKVHPMAKLGTDADMERLEQQLEIKNRQKKEAGALGRQLLESEILPAHLRRLEMDGITPVGPTPEPAEPEVKKLTQVEEQKILHEVAEYRKIHKPETTDIWAGLEKLAEADRFEQLVRYGARGLLIPREHQAWMQYYEQTPKHAVLEKSGYWENVRTSEMLMIRALGNTQKTSQGVAING
jgi:putative transposase